MISYITTISNPLKRPYLHSAPNHTITNNKDYCILCFHSIFKHAIGMKIIYFLKWLGLLLWTIIMVNELDWDKLPLLAIEDIQSFPWHFTSKIRKSSMNLSAQVQVWLVILCKDRNDNLSHSLKLVINRAYLRDIINKVNLLSLLIMNVLTQVL